MPSSASRRFDEPASEASVFLSRVGLAILLIATPVSAVATRRLVFILVPMGAALLLLAALIAPQRAAWRREGLREMLMTSTALAALFLAFWATLSLVWTPFPAEAGERFFKSLGTALLVAVTVSWLPERTRTSNLYLLPIGVGLAALSTLAAAVLGPASLRGAAIDVSTLDRAVVGQVVLVWPALAALAVRERWGMAAALATAITAAAIAVWTPLALVALIIGALTFAFAVGGPERAGKAIGAAAAATFLLAPLAALLARGLFDPQGPVAAFVAWGVLIASEPERLVTGHGLGTAARMAYAVIAPAAPRSLLFETWYELGIVGAAGAAAVSWFAFSAAGRASPALAPFLISGLAAGLGVTLLGLSTTQLWWLTTLAVAALSFALAARGQYRTRRPLVRLNEEPTARIRA